MAIKAVDTVRTADAMSPFDAEGYEGRWLDVPRLPALNPANVAASSFWSGRAAAAMVYDYYCKFDEKPDEMIGHDEGDAGKGPNGAKLNLRYLGGSQKGKLAGLDDGGKVDVQRVFSAAGLAVDGGNFAKGNEIIRAEQAERRLQPIVDQLKKNNPVLLYTALSKGEGGHIVVVSGYKKTREGMLWLRITDPDAPKADLIGGEIKMITQPGGPEAGFSEYWLRAPALFAAHPSQPPKRFYSYTGNPGRYLFVLPKKAVPDSHELVHKLLQGAQGGEAAPEEAVTVAGKGEAANSAKKEKEAEPETAKAPEKEEVEGEEGKKEETKETAPKKESGRSVEEIEPLVIAGDYKDAGNYEGKFSNADLQKLLEHYCKQDSIDPAASGTSDGKAGGSGDGDVSGAEHLPLWYGAWRMKVAQGAKWGPAEQGRSRLGEAWSRWFFRKLCKDKSVEYPLSADEHFAQLWKSNGNKKSPDMGGPSGIYCAAAGSLGFERGVNSKGYYLLKPGTQSAPQLALGSLKKHPKPLPGDVLSIVSAGTPRTGHVVTVICPLTETWDEGDCWVVSGNTKPSGAVAIDLYHFDKRDPQFNPYLTVDGKLVQQWRGEDKKPPAGKCWVYACQVCSDYYPDKLEGLDDAALKKMNLKKKEPKETPGSKPGKVPPEPESKSESKSESDSKSEPESKSGSESDSKSETKSEPDSQSDSESKSDSDSESKPAEKKEPKAKPKNDGPPPPAACPPKTGFPRLPIALDGSLEVTGDALTSLYHSAERGNGGYFPLGDAGLMHGGIHLMPEAGSECYAIADGEVVAAKIGGGPGQHPWGDTGFVLTRHVVKGDKNVYSLAVHLKQETLHPDRTEAGWLKRLLIAAMGGDPPKKTKWRVIESLPTWTDEDKGKFSPTTIKNDKLLEAGVYEEEDQVILDHKHYVKLKGMWVRGAGGAGDEDRIKELSPWSSFDIEEAAKNSEIVKALHEGKVAVLDTDKKDGKRRWTVDAGEPIGACGNYLGAPALHWSIFTKDAVFPTGSLLDEEWGQADEVKLAELDLSSKEHGTPEHGKALVEALDPDKKVFAKEKDESVVQPTELRKFYRAPTLCWRARYQAVKGLVDFKLDVDKLMGQDRYKSHAQDERDSFKENAKPLLFWDDLSSADDFPTDGKAIFIHPVTAVRLMSSVAVAQDHDDPKELPGGLDRLHADEDVVVSLRDKDGPMAAVKVTIKAGGKVVKSAQTDAAGEIVVQLEDLAGQDVEVSVDESVIGKDGMLVTLANETSGKTTLSPGDAPGNQSFNGKDVVPDPKVELQMRVKDGSKPVVYQSWNETLFKPEDPVSEEGLADGREVTVERFVFRREDGKFEAVEALLDGQRSYLWAIEDGKVNLVSQPQKTGSEEHKDPAIHATWSARVAHVNEHPVLAGRVENIDDGTEVDVTFFAMRGVEAPEHDLELESKKVKIAAGGLSADFDPAQLVNGQSLLNEPRPVFAKVKSGEHVVSLRDQAVTIYAADMPFPDAKPPPAERAEGDGRPLPAFFQIKRGSAAEKLTLWDGSPALTKKLKDIHEPASHRFVGEAGQDEVYVGTITTMPHLSTEEEARMTPAAALAHHKEETLKAEPDLPAWAFSAPAVAATADNGISSGLCATHCKTEVCAEGLATGCNDQIRTRNLGSCHNAHHGECQKAVQPSKPLKILSCGGYAGSCGEVAHDKSKCFVADPVLGPGAADRERWSVALPMRIKDDKKYDYKGNLRVVLVNPINGRAVVASQEARGPKAKSEGHDEVEHVSLKKNELKDKGYLAACSYEVAWRLGLSRSAAGDNVVLVAFVPATTPLGPVADDKVFSLRKEASREEIAGTAPVPEKLVPPPRPPVPKKANGAAAAPPSPKGPAEKPPKNAGPSQPTPAAEPAKLDARALATLRKKMVETAKAEVGQVDDRGGDGGKRRGWEHLKEYLEKALKLDVEKQGWLSAIQKPGARAGDLQWCGIFAVWCAIQSGLDAKWQLGKGPAGLGAPRGDKKFLPGDILVVKGKLNHHCVLTGIGSDGKLETVNGNSYYQSVSLAIRDPGEIGSYYRISEQGFEG